MLKMAELISEPSEKKRKMVLTKLKLKMQVELMKTKV